MDWIASDAFERGDKEDHSKDPALAVDGLSDLFPLQITLDMESALAVGTLAEFFPGQEADEIAYSETSSPLSRLSNLADFFPGREVDPIGYFSTADDAPTTIAPIMVVPVMVVPAETPADDELCESEQVFESGDILQSDIQRAALEFQRFAEKFHTFAAECQERVTV